MNFYKESPFYGRLLREDCSSCSRRLELGFKMMGLGEDDPGDEEYELIDGQLRSRADEQTLYEMTDGSDSAE